MLLIRKLIWDNWNATHIARHKIVPGEVEAVCHNLPILLLGQKKKRLVLIGPTEEMRMITVVLEAKGRGTYYIITAYPTDDRDITLYKRLRGGRK